MAKKIMIQGTMSNVGKSLICAGLCRIFRQDGFRTAPFKSQNMALNSFITEEGLEMGRAQAVQAEAAGIAPQVQMNPILLKPTDDMGSQIIVNGEVLGNMGAREYFSYKKKLVPDIMDAFHKLEEEFDIIVIEGAGSPAEINLKADDIVNMGLAGMVDSPVLLVGDIDRGGVFAQLLGTLMLLEEEERKRVKGLVINKFRGDKSILDPGVVMLEERGKVPVVGVTPYLRVEIEDEDSLAERFASHHGRSILQAPGQERMTQIEIAVIRLPRVSNFTDFLVLENIERVSLRYVQKVSELQNPDMILLPGTKNTIGDLLWLRQSGLEAEVKKAASRGTVVWGICGGYQMLGEELEDPEGVESFGKARTVKGMCLLPVRTVLTGRKARTRVSGVFGPMEGLFKGMGGKEFEGYEIHMGITKGTAPFMLHTRNMLTGEESQDGAYKGNVCGTYIHGIFDREEVLDGLLPALAEKKGLSPGTVGGMDYKAFKERQYDILADALRAHLDMDKIYEIMEK